MALKDLNRESSTRRAEERAPDFYLAYLNSPSWRVTRNRALSRARYTCARCGAKRDLNVHHLTYVRLGAELDADLEVLCFSCHRGHHRAEIEATPDGIYLRLVSEIIKHNPLAPIADIADDVRRLCVKFRIPQDIPAIDRAIAMICSTRTMDRAQRPYESVVDKPLTDETPLTHAQCVEWLARLREATGLPMNAQPMPKPRLVTQGTADKLRAFAQVTAMIRDSIDRCEALEREAEKSA